MRYKHFHPDYRTWEENGPIALTLTTAREGEVIFTNEQSAPQHAAEMGYRLTGPQSLHSWVVALQPNGSTNRVSFDFFRVG